MPHSPSAVRIASAALVILTLAGCTSDAVAPTVAPALSAASGEPSLAKGASVSDNYTFPVTFDIPVPWDPTNACGLDTPVHGEGVFHVVAKATQTASGGWRINLGWSAHGTAVGDDGSQYRFNYALAAQAKDLTGPNNGLPGNFEIVDHFNLIGQGNTPDLKVSFRALVNLDGADPTSVALAFNPVEFHAQKGDALNCDPI